MMARCENAEVRIDGPGGIRASFDLRNTSPHTWRPSEGFAVGYQIFDPEAGTLVVDGARVVPDADIAPGDTRGFDLRFDLPPGEGPYRVYVSPLKEHVGWFYEGGAEFLVIDATLESGRAGIKNFRVATGQAMRRERFFRAAVRAVTLPAAAIIRNHSLIRSMVRRDLLGRYRGSFGGVFWTILNPLILMLT
jgi:hypothetical protein